LALRPAALALPLLLCLALGCAPRALHSFDLTPYPGIPGPEDLVLDGADRLLVSSQDRRTTPAPPGAVFALHMSTGLVSEMHRDGEPAGLVLHPHGMDLVRSDDGALRLYVISHRPEGEEPPHAIVVYRVEGERLAFEALLEDPLLASPNDLAALPDGQLYVGNDKSAGGGMSEVILGLKRSTLVHFDGRGTWKVVAEGLAYCNGVAVVDDRVIVAATRENAIYAFERLGDGSLADRTRLARVTAPDNFFVAGADLFVAAHPRPMAFVAHARKGKPSPSHVYRLNLDTQELQLLFADDGAGISASSTAIWLDQTLWIGQVFGPFVLRATVRPPDAPPGRRP
jgi:sugar lactone lactonase YvrE